MWVVANVTGSGEPSGRLPSNHRPPSHLRAAHPVTAPYAGSTAPASTIRCSGSVESTHEGTYSP